MAEMPRTEMPTRRSPAEAILDSARAELEKNGIVGLRVADVAKGADVSLTQIYRYFDDRNGLLARVLGDIYDEIVTAAADYMERAITNLESVTIENLVDAFPPYSEMARGANQRMRLQIMAMSVTNPRLHERITASAERQMAHWKIILDQVERRLAPGEELDRRVFEILLPVQMPYYWNMLGENAFTDEEFRAYFIDLARGRRC